MIQINVGLRRDSKILRMNWQPITTAPFDRDLELAVITYDGTHALVFPCRRLLRSWINAETKQLVDVRPTHWRDWEESDRRFTPPVSRTSLV
jgi:hypothetical protein